MKFRPVRGGLARAMREVREFSNRFEFEDFILNMSCPMPLDIATRALRPKIEVTPYPSLDRCWDERIGWHTYIVTLNGHPMGFTDGPVPE